MPSSGRSAVERRRPAGARRREPGVRGVGLGERPLAVDREPGVQRPVVALGGVEVGLGQLARRDLARAQERGHLVGEEPREVGHRVAAQPSRRGSAGTTMKSPSRVGGVARAPPRPAATAGRRRRAGCSRARSSGPSAGCRRCRARQVRVLVEDVVELALEPGQLLVGQAEAREVRDVLDVRAGQGGHGRMISDRPATIASCSCRRSGR